MGRGRGGERARARQDGLPRRARGRARGRRGAARASCRAAATLYLVAVGIEKPGNLGAMARTAEAAGADALVVAEAQADPWNPNAIRASTGAVFTLPVVEATLADVAGLDAQLVAAVVGAPTALHRRRPARRPTRARVGAEDAGLAAPWLARRRPPRLDPAARPQRRQPQRRDGRRGPPLRGGAPAWLAATTSSARARDRRPPPAHADARARARSARASSASSSSAPARSSRAARSTSWLARPRRSRRAA